jgi:hypothetical protein
MYIVMNSSLMVAIASMIVTEGLKMLANGAASIAGEVKGIAGRELRLDSTSQDPFPPHLPPRHERACLRGGVQQMFMKVSYALITSFTFTQLFQSLLTITYRARIIGTWHK